MSTPYLLVEGAAYPLVRISASDGAAILKKYEDTGTPIGYPFYFWDDADRHYFPEPMSGLRIEDGNAQDPD